MKRFHVHIAVNDLAASIAFYSKLFGQAPVKEQPDYAKWMLDDPRLNFALSQRGRAPGLDHLGLQVESVEELAEIGARLSQADYRNGGVERIRADGERLNALTAELERCYARWEELEARRGAS